MKKILILLFFIISTFYLNGKNINDKTKDDSMLFFSAIKIIDRDYIEEVQFNDLFIKTIKNIITDNNLPIKIIEENSKLIISYNEYKKEINLNNFNKDSFIESFIDLRELFEKDSIHIVNNFSGNYIIMLLDYILNSLDSDNINGIITKDDFIEEDTFSIGIHYKIDENNNVIIKGTIDNGPAQKAGIFENDLIFKINNQEIKNLKKDEIDKILNDKQNPVVELTILRGIEKKEINFLIDKEVIIDKKIETSILDNKIGYVKIFQIFKDFPDDLENILDKMSKDKIRALIIDLRNSPGGFLIESIESCELFLKKNNIIIKMKGRNPHDNKIFKNDNKERFKIPIVILSNELTASGAEIIIAALHDNKRCIIIGEKTYGNAKIVTVYRLNDEFFIKLAIASFITPNGKIIHGIGIEPDYLIKNENNEDLQLQKAIELIKNKKVLLE